MKDIEGNILYVGDDVYYARKNPYAANGLLIRCTITKISNSCVYMEKFISTEPSNQLIKIQKI